MMEAQKSHSRVIRASWFIARIGPESFRGLPNGVIWKPIPELSLAVGLSACDIHGCTENIVDITIVVGQTILGDEFSRRAWASVPIEQNDGKFSMIECSGSAVRFRTDSFGFGSLFLYEKNSTRIVATHLEILLREIGTRPRICRRSLAEYLYTRTLVSKTTIFEDVERLGIGEELIVYKKSGRVLRKRGDGKDGLLSNLYTRGAPRYSPTSVADLLEESMERFNTSEEDCLMLSGGNDSLAVALAARHQKWTAVTYGNRYSKDLLLGRLRAKNLKISFRDIPLDDWNISESLEKNCCNFGNLLDLRARHNLVAFAVASKSFGRAFCGFFGDAITGGHLFSREDLLKSHIERVIVQNWNNPLLNVLFLKERKEIEDLLRAEIYYWSRDIPLHSACMLSDLKYRQRGWIAQIVDASASFMSIACPLFFRPLFSAALLADFDCLWRQRDYLSAIKILQARRNVQMPSSVYAYSILALNSIRLVRLPVGRIDWSIQKMLLAKKFAEEIVLEYDLREIVEPIYHDICEERAGSFEILTQLLPISKMLREVRES